MKLVDKYIIKQLLYNSFLILLLIISVFSLAKSVQLIELMVGRGLPVSIFIKLIIFSLPQIIPVLLPIIISLSIYFVFSRMQSDKELIILKGSNFSTLDLMKPIFVFCFFCTVLSAYFTLHQAPKSQEDFKILLYSIKNDYSSTLLQEGTFNNIGKDFTIFVKQRTVNGLSNIFIHDSRDMDKPSTLIAKKGQIIKTSESTKILLEDGSQQFQSKDKKLSILYFEKYLLDVNEEKNSSFLNRWKSPSERSIYELKNPDMNSGDDRNNLQAFKAEIFLRYAMPLNVTAFSILVAIFMVSSKYERVERISKTIKIILLIVFLQIISIMSSNVSIKYQNMEYTNFLPLLFCAVSSIYYLIFKDGKLR